MSQITVRQIVNPTKEELDKVARTLAAAFDTDQFTLSCVGGDKSQIFAFERATAAAAAAIAGKIWVASYGDTDYASVALWFVPGRDLLDTPDQGEAGFNDLFESFSPELAKWWMEYFLPKYNVDTTKALGEGVKVAAWNLQLIGTVPKYQCKGLASALVKAVSSRAKAEGEMVTVETEEQWNVPIYESWEFAQKLGPEPYDSLTGGFDMWVLAIEN
ncbi:acyl-CoA N-acyltransferase [Amylostereum chailletii]|nr:acyl-CoA N-acyltransferase [Amylostereum chailletii]